MATEPKGTFLGLPYNWRRPTVASARKSVWDPEDDRVLTPKNFGWGYNLNLAAIRRRLGSGRK